jgi:hypothetical protein
MNKNEWDKCFFWIATMFPQWQVTAITSKAWFDEIGTEATAAQFQDAVRNCMSENPSCFPPGAFEIKAKLRGNFEQVDLLWQQITKFSSQGKTDVSHLSRPARLALRAIGGISKVGMQSIDKLEFLKKDFVRAFNDFKNRPEAAVKNDFDEIENSDIRFLAQNTTRRLQ